MHGVSKRRVAVFGSSQCTASDALWAEAYALGAGLARADCTVVTGGYGGVMEAASHGARQHGGHTVGLTVGEMGERPPNAHVAERIHAADLHERLRNFLTHADAWIAMPGGVGTLLEIALLWNLKVLHALDGPPVWLVGPGWDAFGALCRAHLAIRPQDYAHIAVVPDSAAALAAVVDHFGLSP